MQDQGHENVYRELQLMAFEQIIVQSLVQNPSHIRQLQNKFKSTFLSYFINYYYNDLNLYRVKSIPTNIRPSKLSFYSNFYRSPVSYIQLGSLLKVHKHESIFSGNNQLYIKPDKILFSKCYSNENLALIFDNNVISISKENLLYNYYKYSNCEYDLSDSKFLDELTSEKTLSLFTLSYFMNSNEDEEDCHFDKCPQDVILNISKYIPCVDKLVLMSEYPTLALPKCKNSMVKEYTYGYEFDFNNTIISDTLQFKPLIEMGNRPNTFEVKYFPKIVKPIGCVCNSQIYKDPKILRNMDFIKYLYSFGPLPPNNWSSCYFSK